jgi:hypothetical protein
MRRQELLKLLRSSRSKGRTDWTLDLDAFPFLNMGMDPVAAKKGSEKEMSDAIHLHLLKASAVYHSIFRGLMCLHHWTVQFAHTKTDVIGARAGISGTSLPSGHALDLSYFWLGTAPRWVV